MKLISKKHAILLVCLTHYITAVPLQWRQYNLTETMSSVSRRPVAVSDAALVYYSPLDFLVFSGGRAAEGTAIADTWVLDMTQRRFYLVDNVTSPQRPSSRYGSTYGIYADQMFLFGGCSSGIVCFNDLWSFNIRTFTWRLLNASGVYPTARAFASGGLFAGYSGTKTLGSFTCAPNFEMLSDIPSVEQVPHRSTYQVAKTLNRPCSAIPTLESGHSVYNPNKPHARAHSASVMASADTMIMFGGCVKHGPCPARDLWMFSGGANVWRLIDACPPASLQAQLVLSALNDRPVLYMFGGNGEANQLATSSKLDANQFYSFDVSSAVWSIRSLTGTSPTERFAASTCTGRSNSIIMFGGIDISSNTPLNELWVLEGDQAAVSTLSTTCPMGSMSLITVHGLLMVIAFSILSHGGAAFAYIASNNIRISSMINVRTVHVVAQVSCGILAFIGFIIAVIMIPSQRSHLTSAHGWLGLFILLGFIAQITVICVSRSSVLHQRALMRTHMWLGLILLMFAVLNTILGLFLAMAPTAVWLSYFLFIFASLAAYCIAQTMNIF